MSKRERIVFLYQEKFVPPEVIDMLRAHLPERFELDVVEQDNPSTDRHAAVTGADYVLGYPGDVLQTELQAATNLKLLQLLSAGYEHVDLDAFNTRAIPVANNGGANAPTVAEHSIMLMLAVYRKLPLHHNALHDGHWLGTDETLNMRELRGKTLGIVGFGKIGQEVARVSSGFQTRNLYFDAVRTSEAVEQELAVQYFPLPELLDQADVVTIHTALNEQSENLINAEMLALMKTSAILINTSRGPVVDEPALIEALRKSEIAGAGLDVFRHQPLDPHSPLLSLPNVVVTPHHAGVSLDTWTRRITFGYENIERVASGKPAEAIVS